MAHITARLIWYKLGERAGKMADAIEEAGSWFENFTWSEHILDTLLIGWIAFGVLLGFGMHAYTAAFGPLQFNFMQPIQKSKGGPTSVTREGSGESVLWLNSTLNWFYLHFYGFPEFIDAWIVALNEQARKLGGPVQVKFEAVLPGTLPPKLQDVYSEPGPKDTFIFRAVAESRDLSFRIFASQQTPESLKLTNCFASVQRLRGGLKVIFEEINDDIIADISFDGRPDIKVSVRPANPNQSDDDLVDLGIVEEVIRNSICMTATKVALSHWRGPVVSKPAFEPIDVGHQAAFQQEVASVQQSSLLHSAGVPAPRKPRRVGEKRLLVKIIKASGVASKEGGVHPFCIILIDNPPQDYMTSVVKSTNNPFWDENFLFEVQTVSKVLTFELYNKTYSQEIFLGQAVVYIEDLRKTPSSRQILPLQCRQDQIEPVTGSITAEFLFMDPSEADRLIDPSLLNKQLSPRRLIETNRTVTPSGTVVTTTTTTTERPQNARPNSAVDGPPNLVEKQQYQYIDDSPIQYSFKHAPAERSLSASSELIVINGVESVAETAMRELMEKSRRPKTPTKTSTIVITSVKRMIESTPTDESHNAQFMHPSSTPPTPTIEKDKKKMTFGERIKKKFGRPKKRSVSADRASSLRDGPTYLRPPDQNYGSKSTDDIDAERARQQASPNLKKSRSLGGSLRRLFRRSRRSRSRDPRGGDSSRESSISRGSSMKKEESRDSSLKRPASAYQQRASVS